MHHQPTDNNNDDVTTEYPHDDDSSIQTDDTSSSSPPPPPQPNHRHEMFIRRRSIGPPLVIPTPLQQHQQHQHQQQQGLQQQGPPQQQRQNHHRHHPKRRYSYQWPIRFRCIERIDHRYNPNHQNHWQQQQQREQLGPEKIYSVCLRRRSLLVSFLLGILLPYVAVDDGMFLPTGLILYVVALTVAWEQWTVEVMAEREVLEHLRKIQMGQSEIEAAIRSVEFEYHVLRNLPTVRIIPMKEITDDGIEEIVLYAV